MADSEVTTVSVVFGVEATSVESNFMTDIAAYASDFNISETATQLRVLDVCRRLVGEGHFLAVRKGNCIIEEFLIYLSEQKESFPVDPGVRIHSLMDNFIASRGVVEQKRWQSHVGFTLDGRIRFIKLEIVTNLPKRVAALDAWDWSKRWDDFINKINEEKGARCFHTSYLWVRADAERQLVSTTLMCALASISSAFVAVFWFLGNILSGLLLIFNVISIIAALSCLMFAGFGWTFGAIEAVSLIIVVGFSVDYGLHITEAYSQSPFETRWLRVQDALRRTGGALLGAMATSVLACPPILLCTMTVFVQFGLTLIVNMVLAFLFSVLFLCASLVMVGPTPGGCKCSKICSRSASAEEPKWFEQPEKSPAGAPVKGAAASNGSAPGSRYALQSDQDVASPFQHKSASMEHLSSPTTCQVQAWTHLSQPSMVSAPSRNAVNTPGQSPSGESPSVIGNGAWQEAEQPDDRHARTRLFDKSPDNRVGTRLTQSNQKTVVEVGVRRENSQPQVESRLGSYQGFGASGNQLGGYQGFGTRKMDNFLS